MSGVPPPPPPRPLPPPSPPAHPIGRLGGTGVPATPGSGLRVASAALLWATAAMTWLLLVAVVRRRQVWFDVVDGEGSIFDLADADDLAAVAAFLQVGLIVASAIVLSIWAFRTAQHARAFGATDVSPGWACGGWFVPIGFYVIPFVQMRRIAWFRAAPRAAIGWWQGLFIAAGLTGSAFRTIADLDAATSADDLGSRLGNQVALVTAMAVLLTAAAFAAMRAMGAVDGSRRTTPA